MAALRLVPSTEERPAEVVSEVEVCDALARFHYEQASRLEPDSERRALVLRCAWNWTQIAHRAESEEL